MKKTPRILVVNDDGIHGPGLDPLVEAMRKVGDVTVVVPDKERSADSHSLTLHKPLRVLELKRKVYIVNGSPADCARLGVLEIMKDRVDLLASGINRGFNLGQDVAYSGTVAGAMEGTLLGIPSFAVSQGVGAREDFAEAADFARRLALKVLKNGLPRGVCLNVNSPERPGPRLAGARVTRLGKRVYGKKITVRSDPRGHQYFWIAGKYVSGLALPGSDVAAIQACCVSVTPLHVDNTHAPSLALLRKWRLS